MHGPIALHIPICITKKAYLHRHLEPIIKIKKTLKTIFMRVKADRVRSDFLRIIGSVFFASLLFCNNIHAQDKLYHNEFSLADVTLLDGPFKHARDLNIKVLLEYDVDRLLQPFRKEAGLPEKGQRYQNWAGLDGHVGGHYLTALAMNYTATKNAEC